MASCAVCGKQFGGLRYKRFSYSNPAGFAVEICLDCMRCSVCGSPATGAKEDVRTFNWPDSKSYCSTCWRQRTPEKIASKGDEIAATSCAPPPGLVLDREETAKAIVPAGKGYLGKLVLTDQRLAALGTAAGELRSIYPLESVAGLESAQLQNNPYITGVNIIPKSGEPIHIGVQFRAVGYGYAEFLAAFTKLRERRLERLKKEEIASRTQIIIDFSWLREHMEKGGMVVNVIKCPSCGGNVKTPASGSSTRCEYCGSDIQAVDIFKKIKEMIG